ncbi:MAG: YcnI family copper-binding membrane protein [Leucobacter sp.]
MTETKTRKNASPVLKVGAAAFGAIALTLGGAAAAQAHVGISTPTPAAGTHSIVTVSVPHGCGHSPTTKVAIQMPDDINSVTPTRNSFYDVEAVTETLDPAIEDSHGNPITERVSEVIYTANTPLPSAQRDAFELSLQLPEDAAGETLYFPVVQTCEEGESAWVQLPAEGQDPHELELPAPAIAVVAASDAGHGHDAGEASADGSAESGATGTDLSPLIYTALGLGVIGAIAGLTALLRRPQRA